MKSQLFLAAAFLVCSLPASARPLYFGADLSFANRMADCGAVYRDSDGKVKDVYTIFKDHGANLIRVRLWTGGNKTGYSDLLDVEKTIRAAHALGMKVELDFHYSDRWADAIHQTVPRSWAAIAHVPTNGIEMAKRTRAQDLAYDKALAATLYQYTYYILTTLDHQGLMPDIVQVGNEINVDMLQQRRKILSAGQPDIETLPLYTRPIDWRRDAIIINAGIRAVRAAGAKSAIKPRVMLQIAHPQSVVPWFAAATKAGVTDYDIIGISYYAFHDSPDDIRQTGDVIRALRKAYPGKDVMVAETGYPWTANPDLSRRGDFAYGANLLPGYPATPDGQKDFLFDLTRTVLAAGGDGVNYWAPARVPSKCMRHGNGSATSLFDMDGNVLPGIDFMKVRAGDPR